MNIRNIGFFAHIDAGKTTLTERFLYECGAIQHQGNILDGTTESDYDKDEVARGISIYNSVFQFEYSLEGVEYSFNLIDTPGHLDFGSQVESALKVVDVAILLIDAGSGIQSQTEIIFRKLKRSTVPVLIFINKADSYPGNIQGCLDDISVFTEKKSFPLLETGGESFSLYPDYDSFPESSCIRSFEWNDDLAESFLKKPENISELTKTGLANAWKKTVYYPVLAGSAITGAGVKEMVNWLCRLEPGVIYRHDAAGIFFKKTVFPDRKKFVFFKTYRDLYEGEHFFSGNRQNTISSIYRFFGPDYSATAVVEKFSVGALMCDLDVKNGDFIYTTKPEKYEDRSAEDQSLFGIIIEPEIESDREDILNAVELVVWEDDGLSYIIREETGQIELKGRGELHLEIALSRLKTIFSNKFNVGQLKVARYDKLKILVKNAIFRHSVYGGEQESGDLTLSLEESDDFRNEAIFETELPDLIHNSVKTAFAEVMSHGISGREIVGVRLRVHSYVKPERSSEDTFKLIKVAVISGLKKIIEGNTESIGPVSFLELNVPSGDTGSVLKELQKRDARIASIESHEEKVSVVKAEAAAENLLGFAAVLRNMTHGKGFLYINTLFSKENFAII